MQQVLQDAYEYAQKYLEKGVVASYIPELAKEDKHNLGAAIIDLDGKLYQVGDSDYEFTIQSVSKVATYLCVLENYGLKDIKNHVGVKASSRAFNSIIELELSNKNIPVNPFINAGAIVCTSMLFQKYGDEAFDLILNKLRAMTNNKNLSYSEATFESERATSCSNRALTYMMMQSNIIPQDVDVERLLSIYFKCCSILVTAVDLANMSYTLSNDGVNLSGEKVSDEKYVRAVRTLMATCGTYDYAGDFALRVGLPAKSGVGGGIVVASKAKYGIGVYSPGLDSHGNSYAGIRLLTSLAKDLDLNIY